jgi:competence protein ComEA
VIGRAILRKMDINHTSLDELKSHPYIRWNLARVIIEYRNQHGSFGSLEELKRLNIIGPAVYQKLVPYLTLDSL